MLYLLFMLLLHTQTHGVCVPEPQAEAQVTTLTEQVTVNEDNVEELIAEQHTESLECNEKSKVAPIDVTEAESQSCSVEVAVDETESIESELVETDVVGVISNDVTEPDVEAEEEEEEEEPVEVAVDESGAVEPELVEPEPAEVVSEAQVVECEESHSSEEEESETELLSDEDPAETIQITQVAPIPNGDLQVESDALPLPPLTSAPEPVTQVEEAPVDTADVMVDDFVVTASSAQVIEPQTIELLPVFEKPTGAVCEIFGLGPAKMIPEPELVTPAENVLTDVVAASLETSPLEEGSLTNSSVVS
ncbi:uncharacterized protein [Eucyclogobius newberryi]|uniref:uncharacterized protein n=1 Tax=Eucyclogobius newberryi TaxID=166745 RepID=UPI003B5B940B